MLFELNFVLDVVAYVGHVGKMAVFGSSNREFNQRLHQYVVPLCKKLNPHCFSRFSCEMNTRGENAREFNAMTYPEEVALKIQRIFATQLPKTKKYAI